jgi:hypothetical protein
MSLLTGANGSLKYLGSKVAKCRDWSVSIARDALETTGVGSYDRTYVAGLRGATGTATILYDPDDNATLSLLNSIFANGKGSDNVQFVFDTRDSKQFDCDAVLTDVSPSVSVGEIVAVSVSFQITGEIKGGF